MAVGSALALPCMWHAWRKGALLSAPCMRWLLLSYGLGLYAVFPALLRRLGVPPPICEGWWMNVFLGYPLLNAVKHGGMKAGAFLSGAIFCAQYAALLLAIRRTERLMIVDL